MSTTESLTSSISDNTTYHEVVITSNPNNEKCDYPVFSVYQTEPQITLTNNHRILQKDNEHYYTENNEQILHVQSAVYTEVDSINPNTYHDDIQSLKEDIKEEKLVGECYIYEGLNENSDISVIDLSWLPEYFHLVDSSEEYVNGYVRTEEELEELLELHSNATHSIYRS